MIVNQNYNLKFYDSERKENFVEFNLMTSGQLLTIKTLPYAVRYQNRGKKT